MNDEARLEEAKTHHRVGLDRPRLVIGASRALLAALLLVGLVGVPVPASAGIGGLRDVGRLDEPPLSQRNGPGAILYVDVPGRVMYYNWLAKNGQIHLRAYSLRFEKPAFLWDIVLPGVLADNWSPYLAGFDARRHILSLLLDTDQVGDRAIFRVDTQRRRVAGTWPLSQTVPGFSPTGMTYSSADDHYYLIGYFSGAYEAAALVGQNAPTSGLSGVVALAGADGQPLWSRPVAECQKVLWTYSAGSLIARAQGAPLLSFACVSGGIGTNTTYPGQAGLIRMRIDPKAADSVAAAQFPVDFFAVSGLYFTNGYTGMAAYDPASDRFFLQSLSLSTPGDWVFDGRLDAWVGFIPAASSADYFLGYNEGLGRLYLGGDGGLQGGKPVPGLVVANGRETPVQAGREFSVIPYGFIVTDAGSDRIFVPVGNNGLTRHYEVIADETPAAAASTAVEYDSATTNSPDLAGAFTYHVGNAAGYGAQIVQVGGTGGATSGPGVPIDGVPPGTRAIMSARLGNLDLRPAGASASTQAQLADLNTTAQYDTSPAGPWPYPTVSCLDSGGGAKPQTSTVNGSTATTDCSLAGNIVNAAASTGEISAGPAAVARATYKTTAQRTRAGGTVVITRATAAGIKLELPGGLVLTIGETVSTGTSAAHGRPGTTRAAWTRTVDGVTLVDQTGAKLLSSPGCASSAVAVGGGRAQVSDTCRALSDQLNPLLQTRARVRFPMPELTASPRGAYAAVQMADGDYFEQRTMNDLGVVYRGDSTGLRPIPAVMTEIYNDSTERSRTVTALAATQASSIFTVTPPPPAGGADFGGNSPPPPVTTGPAVGGSTGPGGNGGSVSPPVAPILAEQPGWLFFHRGLRDSLLLVSLAALMLAGATTAKRRRQLVQVLTTMTERKTQ
jgi:hypothetical protein